MRGLNALAAAVSTPLAAPVIAGVRLRGGNAASARGAASLASEAIGTVRACGAAGAIITRMDSAYYDADVIAAIRRADSLLRAAGTLASRTLAKACAATIRASLIAVAARIARHAGTASPSPKAGTASRCRTSRRCLRSATLASTASGPGDSPAASPAKSARWPRNSAGAPALSLRVEVDGRVIACSGDTA